MITRTFRRISGKVRRNLGWWQVLLLGGVCAWFCTPVDAQQGIYPPYRRSHSDQDRIEHRSRYAPEPTSYGPSSFLGQSSQPRNYRCNEDHDFGNWDDDSRHMEGPQDPWEMERPRGPRGYDRIRGSERLRRGRIDESNFDGGYALPDRPDYGRPHEFQGQSDYQGRVPHREPAFREELELGSPSQEGLIPGFQARPEFGTPANFPAGPQFRSPTPARSSEPVVNPAQDIQNRITRRYQSQGFLSLLNMSPQQASGLYVEVMQMIDSRHLQPASVQARVQRGLTNLMYALDNPTFTNTNQLSLQGNQVQAYRQQLQQAQQSPVQSVQEALGILNWTVQISQQMGLRPAATTMEFVYGAVESLDKYSAFVPPERKPGASLQLETTTVGIGVQIEMRDQGAEIVKVLSGSPARTAGLQKGDYILAVAGQQLNGLNVDQAVDLIGGPAGSQVVVGVQRAQRNIFTVTITRQALQLHSVTDIQVLPGTQIGYFKLEKFAERSTEEVENALQQLYRQGAQSLVMDLRGNPGGLLTAAVEISDKFLPQGTIVATRGRTPSDNSQEHATHEHTWKIPLVVLIDNDSASASEIFAAAIQENQRGLIVGRTSYGKGTVQTQFPLQTAGCGLRITTAKFYSPKGREMAGQGVTPDVPVAEDNTPSNLIAGVIDMDVRAAISVTGQNSLQNRNQNLIGGNQVTPNRFPAPFAQPNLLRSRN